MPSADSRGFTLVEMIVAVALFAVVMLVSISALLSLVDANRKAQALQSVINNLNIAVDGMVRAVREGNNYRCGSPNPANPDCTGDEGGTSFYFTPYCPGGSCLDWIYDFHDGRLWKSENGSTSGELPLTAPEVVINSVSFYVVGACPGHSVSGYTCTPDQVQPKVVIVIKGTAGLKANVKTTFHIQSTAVQRSLDI